ncbi:MAG TPA: crosslink repair DNA glycosylase YcaQ family protein, partial [Mycobacteriales bacterium]|nr:crosslink repair DNA glycosylase YcaQ family protein [Mycobacteriales bacterium]
QLVTNARRLAQEGVPPADAERGVAAVVRALADGPLGRAELREHVAAAGVRTQGQALVHVLVLASLRGHVLRGPVVGGTQAFVLARDWLGEPPPVDRAEALARLARRYLAGHGPATDRDLARWSGLPLRDARAGLRAVPVEEGAEGLVRLPGGGEVPPLPEPRLLGRFEPVLLGWVSRADVVGPHGGLVTSNGIFSAFAMVGGRAVATWRTPGGRVALDLLEPVAAPDRGALTRDAVDVERFLTG